jgi:hypothetical protein
MTDQLVQETCEDLLALDEPWRSRFLDTIASRANKSPRRVSDRSDLRRLFKRNPDMLQEARTMLRSWT